MFDPSKSLKKMLGPRTNVPRFGSPNKFDLDGDGISNKKDCQPRNLARQDKGSSQREPLWDKVYRVNHPFSFKFFGDTITKFSINYKPGYVLIPEGSIIRIGFGNEQDDYEIKINKAKYYIDYDYLNRTLLRGEYSKYLRGG